MSKISTILHILSATNYVVVTDYTSDSSISPLYADKFIERLRQEQDGLHLVQYRYNQMLNEIADNELGELHPTNTKGDKE